MDDVNQFSPYQDFTEYSPFGRNYGNPMMNMMMQGMFGMNYMPKPQSGQSMYDSFIQKERSAQFMNLQRSGFMNNEIFKAAGISDNPALGMLGRFAGSPDGMAARLMSPLLGGNPMAASMQLYGGLTGAATMGNFGRVGNISAGETESMMQELSKNFYTRQAWEDEEVAPEPQPEGQPPEPPVVKKGVQTRMREKTQKFIQEQLANTQIITEGRNATKEAGMAYLEDMGLKLEKTETGELTEESKRLVEDFDITGDSDPNDHSEKAERNRKRVADLKSNILTKQQVATNVGNTLDKALAEADEDIQEELNKKLEEQIKKYGMASAEQIKKLKDRNGKFDGDKVEQMLSKYQERNVLENIAIESEAFQEAKGKFTGFNFTNSRGFKIEDFTSGFVKAADLRMLGDHKGEAMASQMGEFSKNAGGTMSAARSLFGNDKSGGELMEKISGLAGGMEMDLTSVDENGDSQMEQLLRKVKATARVAGVSIETMLGIIDSAKELARNNPRLHNLNAGTITEMSVKAVGTAAKMGAAMSSGEFRKAGGTQGIMGEAIKEEMAYMESGIGGGKGAYLAMAKAQGPETYAKALELVSGKTEKDFANTDLLAKMAESINVKQGRMGSILTNETLKSEALKDEQISADLAADMEKTVVPAMFEGMRNSGGMNEEELRAEYKRVMDNGGDFDTFFRSSMLANASTEESRQFMMTYKNTFQRDFMEHDMTPEEKTRFDTRVAEQQKLDTELSKKFDGKNAPVVTQMIDAIAKGDNVKDVAQGMSAIFATEDSSIPAQKKALEEAAIAAEQIAVVSSRVGSDEENAVDMASAINAVNAKRRDAALAVPEAQRTKQDKEAIELGDIGSDTELLNAAENMQVFLGKGTKAAKEDLEALTLKESEGRLTNEDEINRLGALRTAEKIGALNSDEALDAMAGGNGIRSVAAATVEAAKQAPIQAAKEASKAGVYKNLDEDLRDAASGALAPGRMDDASRAEAGAIRAYYQDRGGMEQAMKDFESGAKDGYFTEEKRKSLSEKGAAEKAGALLSGTQDKLNLVEETAAAKGKSPEDKSREDMKKMFESLTAVIKDGGKIADALDRLVHAL